MTKRRMRNPKQHVFTLHPADLLQVRLRKLTTEVTARVATRTKMFEPQRMPGDISDAAQYFPMFLATYMAVAWAVFVANALPEKDSEIYSSKYLDLTMDDEGLLSVLTQCVIEENLLPEYRLGYLTALLNGCHMTEHHAAQRRLWDEFISQVSNLLVSMCAYTERGVQIFEKYTIAQRKEMP